MDDPSWTAGVVALGIVEAGDDAASAARAGSGAGVGTASSGLDSGAEGSSCCFTLVVSEAGEPLVPGGNETWWGFRWAGSSVDAPGGSLLTGGGAVAVGARVGVGGFAAGGVGGLATAAGG